MKVKTKIKRKAYSNAELYKWNNARIVVQSLNDGEDYGIKFTILSDDPSPRTTHQVLKGKVVNTSIRISKESAVALMAGLQIRLLNDGHLISHS